MKFNNINAIYTSAVSEYLTAGYIINAGTMSGSQGEIAHIDLRKGEDVIRILMESVTDYESGCDIIQIVVGRCNDSRIMTDETSDRFSKTIWNQDLEVISVRKFWRFEKRDREWFIEGNDGAAAMQIAAKRRLSRNTNKQIEIAVTDSIKIAILPTVRRVLGIKRFSVNQITRVYKRFVDGHSVYCADTTKGAVRLW